MNWENEANNDGNDIAANEDQKDLHLAAALLAKKPRNQGGGRAKRHCCQELNDVDVEKIGRPLKFGGLVRAPIWAALKCSVGEFDTTKSGVICPATGGFKRQAEMRRTYSFRGPKL